MQPQWQAPAFREAAPPEEPRETFTPSSEEAVARKGFSAKPVIIGLCLAGAVMGAFAPSAYAQEPTPRTSVSAVADTTGSDLVALARRYGLKTEVLEKVNRENGIANVLQVLPANMRRLYSSLDPVQKKALLDQLSGSSGVLFVRVSHRNAFIKGEAAGYNVWDEMQKGLTQQLRDKQLDALTYARLSGAVDTFRTMTPQQRGAWLDLLRADVASLGVR